jgi:hypothetical protein
MMTAEEFRLFINDYFTKEYSKDNDSNKGPRMNEIHLSIPGCPIEIAADVTWQMSIADVLQAKYESMLQENVISSKEELPSQAMQDPLQTKGEVYSHKGTEYLIVKNAGEYIVRRQDNLKVLNNVSPRTKGIIKAFLNHKSNINETKETASQSDGKTD